MVKRFIFISLASLLFIVSAGYILTSLLLSEPPSVILITVESLRYDLITPESTPHLLQAGRKGVKFTRHRAVSGWTGSNIVSLLTGLTPFASGVHTRGQSVDPESLLPLELLNAAGYTVEGTQGFMMMDIYRNLGLQVKPEAADWLYSLSLLVNSGKPFFSWYHYLHTHLPYETIDGYETNTSKAIDHESLSPKVISRLQQVQKKSAIHDGQSSFLAADVPLIHELQLSSIKEFDDWFKRFWDFFLKSGLWRNTILVLTADHGDEHGERGLVGHASTTLAGHLHEEIIRVPLIIWLPTDVANNFPGHDPLLMTSHEDLMPTILELLGQNHQLSFEGRNVLGVSRNSTWMGMTSSGGFAEPDPGNVQYFEYGIISDPWKLLYRTGQGAVGAIRLYNLDADPGETGNVAADNPHLVGKLFHRLQEKIQARTIIPNDTKRDGMGGDGSADEPNWVHPAVEKTFSYDDLQGDFKLEWSGMADREYVLEYIAGTGDKQIRGFLNINGNTKKFGKISRRYWDTWVVPYSSFRIRVREKGGRWSRWLDLGARP